MAYEDNSLVTPEGQETMNNIFDLIYNQDKNKSMTETDRFLNSPSVMKTTVTRFKKNAPKIVTLMRRFMRGNTHVAYNQTGDSGIFVCDPTEEGCGRRDFLWWWEFLDFGIYKSISDWTSSVGINDFPAPSYAKEKGVLIVARIKCNSVNTCDPMNKGCGTTWRGAGQCPNPECNNKKRIKAGCGKEHYAHFWVDTSVSWGSYWHTGANAIEHNGVSIQKTSELPPKILSTVTKDSGYRNQDYNASPFFYRMFYLGLPAEGVYINSMKQCNKHIPYIQIGYKGSNTTRPIGYKCNKCSEVRYAPRHQERFDIQYEINTSISNYKKGPNFVDQTGGLCTNIGDKMDTYAGVRGMFGCNCGGIFEPEMKLPPIDEHSGPMKDQMNQLEQRKNQGRQQARILNGIPTSIPISKCRYAFTHEVLQICSNPQHKSNYYYDADGEYQSIDYQPLMISNRGDNNYKCYDCGKIGRPNGIWGSRSRMSCRYCSSKNIGKMNHSEQTDYCPTCGPTGDSAYIKPHPQRFLYPPNPYTITSPQPLTLQNAMDVTTGDINGYMGMVQWNITLVDKQDKKERHNLRIELPQIYLGNLIPSKFDPTEGQAPGESGASYCPNEEAGPLKDEIEAVSNVCPCNQPQDIQIPTNFEKPSDYGLPNDVCSGMTAQNYTFVVCEGKSNMGFIPSGRGKYTDISPENKYGNGSTSPRFTEIPAENEKDYPARKSLTDGTCKVGTKYSWCDVDNINTQLCNDFVGRQNKSVTNIMIETTGSAKISGTHTHTIVSEYSIPQTGVTMVREKCWTCEKIADIGRAAAKVGTATSLVEALRNNTYYPGYAAIRYYQSTADLKQDSDIIKGNKVEVEVYAGSIGKVYIEGAIKFEQADQTGSGGGWWNWCMPAFKKACASGKDIKVR